MVERAGGEIQRRGAAVSERERRMIMDISKIITKLEIEADEADDKIMESQNQTDMNYYDGYGDGLQRAIDILREAIK